MSRRIARPYATALFEVISKRDAAGLRAVQEELEAVAALLAREPKLLRVFEVPSVTPKAKREVLQSVATATRLRPESRRLLAALAQHYRLRFLPEVVAVFRELVDRREGLQRGRVELPTAPDARSMASLQEALAPLVGARVELEPTVRPELLAGFVVRLGSRVFDGSLRTQLARFAAQGRR